MTGVAAARSKEALKKSSSSEKPQDVAGVPPPPPTGVPLPFTISDIRSAIPAHCFERSALKSGSYLVRDLAVFSVLFVAMRYVSALSSVTPLFLSLAWLAYWVLAGMTLTGVWVVAHEVCCKGG